MNGPSPVKRNPPGLVLAALVALLAAVQLGCPSGARNVAGPAEDKPSGAAENPQVPAAQPATEPANPELANPEPANPEPANPEPANPAAGSATPGTPDEPPQQAAVTPGKPPNGAKTGTSATAANPPAGAQKPPPGSGEKPAAQPPSPPSAGAGAQARAVTGSDPPTKPAEPKEIPLAPRKPLFDGWEKPDLVLVMTGRQNGYLEPCGCAGLTNQKGGLARRKTFLEGLAQRGWPVAAVDVGSQVRRYGAQAELKFRMAADALNKMPYIGVALGGSDLRLSVDALLSVASEDGIFVSANASVLELSPAFRVATVGGKKIGVTSVLGALQRKRVSGDEVILRAARAGLEEITPKLVGAKCDMLVLLAHTTLDESRQLAKQFPQYHVIVTAGGAEEPAYKPEKIEGTKTLLVQVGAKGMYAGVLGFKSGDPESPRFERVPLDSRYKDSPDMLALLKAYQDQLQQTGLRELGVTPLNHPSGRKFVGSTACRDCHEKAYEKWASSRHAHATESLVHPGERTAIPRHFDPECLSCHVTGWNPQKFTPYLSGYLKLEGTKPLHGSGCENCHGPGSDHVAAEQGDVEVDDAEQAKRRLQMRLTLAEAKANKCIECHDHDNSPDFHAPGAFEKYWKKVAHPWRD